MPVTTPPRPARFSFTTSLLALAALTSAATAQDAPPAPPAASTVTLPAGTYRNPVIAGDYADPTVIRVGDTYYSAGTSSEWAPHFPIYTSKDLVNWEQTGYAFDKLPEWTVSSFWAPELYYHNNTFYLYYTARRKSDNISVIGVATSSDPRKGFTDRGIICEWGKEAIDGFVFRDTDGKLYFTWKAYGLDGDRRPVAVMCSEMTEDALHLKGEAFELLQADGKPISAEGQVMTRRGDWYYLFYSALGCCGRDCNYQLEVARAKSLKGPWETSPYNPILAADDKGGWKCPGHGTLVTLPDGRDYFVYHAYSKKENVYTGRQGMLDEVGWSKDGWPFFTAGNTPSASAALPLPGTGNAGATRDFTDTFDTPTLAPQWQWDLARKPGTELAGGTLKLGVSESSEPSAAGTFLGMRVHDGDYTFTTTLKRGAGPAAAGIAIYGEARSAIALRLEGDELALWKITKGKPQKLATAAATAGETLQLRMTVREGHLFRFAASADGKEWKDVGDQETDGAFIPPWDRAPRVGIVAAGKPGESASFDSVELRYSGK